MKKNSSKNMLVCIICSILTTFGLIASIVSLVNGKNCIGIAKDIINIAVSALMTLSNKMCKFL